MDELEDKKPTYLKEINEYMTQQNVIDLVTNKFPKFKTIYQMYQGIILALRDKDVARPNDLLDNHKKTHMELDTTITTFRKNRSYLKNSVISQYSNGVLEGINRKIKLLKRNCYGFRNQQFFFLRIDCIFA